MEEMLEAKYRAAFEAFDSEGRGRVEAASLREFVSTALGPLHDPNIVDSIIASMSPDHTGTITYQGFKDGFSSKLFAKERQETLYRVLLKSEKVGGLLGDWSQALMKLGIMVPQDEAQAIISKAYESVKHLLAMEMTKSGLSPEKVEVEVEEESEDSEKAEKDGEVKDEVLPS